MKAVFCYDGPLYKDKNGNYYDSILNDQMFERYFKVASHLEIIIRTRNVDDESIAKRMDRLSNPHISVIECPNLSSISGFLKGKALVNRILEERIKTADIVFIRLPSVIGNLAVSVCRKCKVRYLVEVVGCPWDSYWNYSLKGKMLAPLAMMVMKSKVKKSPYVLYVTNSFLQKRYPTEGKCINCSNVELAEMNIEILNRRIEQISRKKEKYVVGTAAGLDVLYKGQHYVIRAIGELKKKGITNIEYQLIGNGTGDYLKKVAKESDVEPQINILGQMPHDKVFSWLDGLDMYIQPSRQEGLPRAVIEAMSRGLVCLGARTAGIPELLNEDMIFPNSRSEVYEIADMIQCIISNQAKQKFEAERNFNEAKKYQRDVLVERRTQFFQACIMGE